MIRCIHEYDFGEKLSQVRSVPVSLGPDREMAELFVHSTYPNIDPWCESFTFPTDTLKLSLYTQSGKLIWKRDLGPGVVPGVWFSPVISFDLDRDGVDEIWTVTNTRPDLPMSLDYRVLERIDPFTGEMTGQWPWKGLPHESMSHAYRFMLAAGYAHGEPVLITAQGTYGDMYLQGWNTGMTPRWDIEIGEDEPGARASHMYPVLDFNEDGVDELFWGERVLSVDDGSEVFCCDKFGFAGHSDILVPFVDPQSGKKFIYTVRENYEKPGVKRVVLFDDKGEKVWEDVDLGHMHRAWIACIGENRRYVAMAMSLAIGASGSEVHRSPPILFYYDALTGAPEEFNFPYPGQYLIPLDINGDGYHEFIGTGGEAMGKILDRHGNLIQEAGGRLFRSGKILDMNGMQFMTYFADEGIVRVWADDEAGTEVTAPNAEHYHKFMQHLMASGYHRNCLIDCGM